MSDRQSPEQRHKHPIGHAVWSVLWNDWDPIGVSGTDWPDDEYDSYVWPVIALITRGAAREEIADYLDWAANVNMGMAGNPEATREQHLLLADQLAALRPT